MREIVISKNESEQRVDKFLFKLLDKAPKSFVYKMLRKKNITLNSKKINGSEKLEIGDLVKLFLSDETLEKFTSVEQVNYSSDVKLDIIYEDEDVIFINKPSDMLSQKADKDDVSIIEHLIAYLVASNKLEVAQLKTFKPAICNRLDRNTSGLITAGKSLKGLQVLSKCFHDRSVDKFYLTFVKGQLKEQQKLKGYLIKDEKKNQVKISTEKPITAVGNTEKLSYIETAYRPLWSNQEITLLEVHLITGKPHQIRAHLASLQHGIIGDMKYGDQEYNLRYKKLFDVDSQLLHSYRLEFPSEMSELSQLGGHSFVAPLPNVYKKILEQSGGSYGNLEFERP